MAEILGKQLYPIIKPQTARVCEENKKELEEEKKRQPVKIFCG